MDLILVPKSTFTQSLQEKKRKAQIASLVWLIKMRVNEKVKKKVNVVYFIDWKTVDGIDEWPARKKFQTSESIHEECQRCTLNNQLFTSLAPKTNENI